MAKNAKITVGAVYSKNADYSDPEWISNLLDMEFDPTMATNYNGQPIAPIIGVTIDTQHYFSDCVLIVQSVAAVTIDAHYLTSANGATLNKSTIPASGGVLVVPDFDPTGDLYLLGATGAAEANLLIIQKA